MRESMTESLQKAEVCSATNLSISRAYSPCHATSLIPPLCATRCATLCVSCHCGFAQRLNALFFARGLADTIFCYVAHLTFRAVR